MERLYEFLKSRNLENTIKQLEENKIDPSVIIVMGDEDLKKYFPAYGDRLSVVNFCKKMMTGDEKKSKKARIIETLRSKLGRRGRKKKQFDSSSDEADDKEADQLTTAMGRYGNRNAKKIKRRIEIGWLETNRNGHCSRQVRQKTGGGTRKVSIDKQSTKEDILKIGKDLFFPNGKSCHGPENNFIFDVKDFMENTLCHTETVGEMYEKTKLPMLRFYIVTCPKEEDATCPKEKDSTTVDISGLQGQCKEVIHDLDWSTGKLNQKIHMEKNQMHKTINNSISFLQNDTVKLSDDMPDLENNVTYIYQSGVSNVENPLTVLDIDDIHTDPDDTVQFGPFPSSDEPQDLSETIPIDSSFTSSTSNQPQQELLIRRGYAMEDLIEAFEKDTSLGCSNALLFLKRMLPNGEIEAGDDLGGVLRDTLTEFWQDFYNKCTLGTRTKIPYLRHDFGHSKWDAIGRILKVSYEQCGYFPVMLSRAFINHAVYGTQVTWQTQQYLLEDFLNFVNDSERDILTKALQDFEQADTDDVIEVLEEHKGRRIPKKENIHQTIMEIAEKELIQEPMFVIDTWAHHLTKMGLTSAELDIIHEKCRPTSKRVISMISFPSNMTESQKTVSKYLCKFVKELEANMLGTFLRFMTGSDIICTSKIEVTFVHLEGLSSRPVAHTCSGVLELPEDYQSYPDFRSQFMEILRSNVWVCHRIRQKSNSISPRKN